MHLGGIGKTYDLVCSQIYECENGIEKLPKKRGHIVRQEYGTNYIKQNYQTKSIKEIAQHLETNFSMVQSRIKQLGLKKPMIADRRHLTYKGCKIMNIETGKVFDNMSIAARSNGINVNTFHARIKKFGCYKKFIKVA